MMKILDFVPNDILEECVFITLETVSLQYGSCGNYSIDKDTKWKLFCKKHNLHGEETSRSGKWYNMYLTLCKEGIL